MRQRWHIYFSGEVQGVGFRFTASQVARRYVVCGWVRNLPDRRVEMVIEGDPAVLQDYVDDLRTSTYGHVRDLQLEQSAATDEFAGFEIRRN